VAETASAAGEITKVGTVFRRQAGRASEKPPYCTLDGSHNEASKEDARRACSSGS
jgi:hypothetical protein